MNTRSILLAGSLALCLVAATPIRAAESMTRLNSLPENNKVRIEGTSSLHDWQVQGPIIGGYIEVGPGFPLEPGQEVKAGKVEAFVTVRSLRSVEKDGSYYSDKMDEIMWEKLNQPTNPRILYRCTELTLKEPPKDKDAPYVFDSKGYLVVGGVTNNISMPVKITPLGGKKVKISGSVASKMSDFKIPAASIGLGIVKTGDGVNLSFEWTVGQKSTPAAAK